MTVTISDVREILVGVKAGALPDATVTRWIRVAGIIADSNKGEHVTEADRDDDRFIHINIAPILFSSGFVVRNVQYNCGAVYIKLEKDEEEEKIWKMRYVDPTIK